MLDKIFSDFQEKMKMDENGLRDPIACKNMTEYICNHYQGIDCKDKLIFDAEKNENLFSMWQLGQHARNSNLQDEYIYWLNKIYSHGWQYAEALWLEKHEPYIQNLLYLDSLIWSEVIIPAYDELGNWHMSKGTKADIQTAISIYNKIDCSYYNASEKITKAESLIKRIELENERMILFVEAEHIVEEIGKEAWDLFYPQTRTYIITAQYIYNNLVQIGSIQEDIDYSCVILPLMKALELELKRVFSLKYLQYLEEVVKTPEEYRSLNKIKLQKLRDEWAVSYCCGQYTFKKSDLCHDAKNTPPYLVTRFTLGNLNYIVGRRDTKNGTLFYKTAHDFCKTVIDEDTDKWLKYITSSVDMILNQRNEAAHAGKIASDMDAKYCWEQIIYINTLIRNIVLGTMP